MQVNASQRVFFGPAYLVTLSASGTAIMCRQYIGKTVERIVWSAVLILLVVSSFLHLSIYKDIHEVDVARTGYMKQQVEDGETVIYYSDLPHPDWLNRHSSVPEAYKPKAFKAFYGIGKDSETVEIPIEDMMERYHSGFVNVES